MEACWRLSGQSWSYVMLCVLYQLLEKGYKVKKINNDTVYPLISVYESYCPPHHPLGTQSPQKGAIQLVRD